MSDYITIRAIGGIKLKLLPITAFRQILSSVSVEQAVRMLSGTPYEELAREKPTGFVELSILVKNVYLKRVAEIARQSKLLEESIDVLTLEVQYEILTHLLEILLSGKETKVLEKLVDAFPLLRHIKSMRRASDIVNYLVSKGLVSEKSASTALQLKTVLPIRRDLMNSFLTAMLEASEKYPDESEGIEELAQLKGDIYNIETAISLIGSQLRPVEYAVRICKRVCPSTLERISGSHGIEALLGKNAAFDRMIKAFIIGEPLEAAREKQLIFLNFLRGKSRNFALGFIPTAYILELAKVEMFNVLVALATLKFELPREKAFSLLIQP